MRPVRRPHRAARRRAGRRTAPLAVLELEPRRLLAASDVLSYHDDAASTGQQEAETTLTTQNVNASTFGKQFTTPLDGQVYAQPLVKAGVDITGGAEPGVHNVVYVATEHDSVYALDAQTGDVLWQTSFLDPANGVTTVPAPADVNTSDLTPEIGITSTPVIDPATGLIYVLAQTKQVIGTDTADPHYIQTLHALNLATGQESPVGPTVVADTTYNQATGVYTYNSGPTVNGTGDGSVNGKVTYNALREFQRAALTLVNGTIYFASASHGDNGPYHGWVLGYDAQTLALKAAFNTTPNGGEGGIWQAGGQVASDAAGNLYIETGNGTFGDGTSNANQLLADGRPIGGDYGDSFIKLAVDPTTSPTDQNSNGWGLKVADYFTPYNQLALSNADLGRRLRRAGGPAGLGGPGPRLGGAPAAPRRVGQGRADLPDRPQQHGRVRPQRRPRHPGDPRRPERGARHRGLPRQHALLRPGLRRRGQGVLPGQQRPEHDPPRRSRPTASASPAPRRPSPPTATPRGSSGPSSAGRTSSGPTTRRTSPTNSTTRRRPPATATGSARRSSSRSPPSPTGWSTSGRPTRSSAMG